MSEFYELIQMRCALTKYIIFHNKIQFLVALYSKIKFRIDRQGFKFRYLTLNLLQLLDFGAKYISLINIF